MKEAQGGRRSEVERGKVGRKRENKCNVQAFIDALMNCQILYHMKADTAEKQREDEQKSKFNIFKHAFLNQFMPDQTGSSYASSKLPTNETFFDAINSNNQSKEEQEYSKYLKQYQTVVKHSRKNQFRSPQQQNKEMKLLINEFLSDISLSQQNNQSTIKVIPTPTKNTTVKVKKIDLNKFSSNRQKTNKSFATTQEVIQETDRQKSNKDSEAVSPRFINVTDVKPKAKKNTSQSKSKEKLQIQVIKVQDLGAKPAKKVTKNNNITPIAIAKKPIVKTEMITVQDPPKSISHIQHKPQNGYSNSYQRIKLAKQPVVATKVQQQKSSKKPLKIEIQIPLEEVSPDQQASPTLSNLQKSEQFQRQKIIKEVSNAVLNLIRKATTVTNRNL